MPSNAIIVNQTPTIGGAEADLGWHHPCRVKYCAGVGIPITVDQPGVATRNALSVSRYPVCLNRQFMERMVLS